MNTFQVETISKFSGASKTFIGEFEDDYIKLKGKILKKNKAEECTMIKHATHIIKIYQQTNLPGENTRFICMTTVYCRIK